MSTSYWIVTFVLAALLGVIGLASYFGWGLDSDAAAEARARQASVRGGSLHSRSYYGGGPGYGK